MPKFMPKNEPSNPFGRLKAPPPLHRLSASGFLDNQGVPPDFHDSAFFPDFDFSARALHLPHDSADFCLTLFHLVRPPLQDDHPPDERIRVGRDLFCAKMLLCDGAGQKKQRERNKREQQDLDVERNWKKRKQDANERAEREPNRRERKRNRLGDKAQNHHANPNPRPVI